MLVLTRKVGQNIVVGEDVRISVIDVRGKQVRLGVEAPEEMPIHREEVFIRIQDANLAASTAGPEELSGALELVGASIDEVRD